MTPQEVVVEEREYAAGDKEDWDREVYLVIPEIQVFCDEFKVGDRVRVTIEKIE